MDLPSVLGGLAQGFVDFGKSAVDLFGTGGAAFADLIQGTGTKNQDDFRKWLYQTDSVKDAAAKGLGTALNGAQTISDYVIPGGISKSLLFNAGQGALGGLADEFKTYGENYDLGRAGQRALVSAGAAGAGTGLANALKKSGSGLLQSGLAQGASRGALSGAINQGGYAAIDGGDIAQSALQGAGMGALLGGATGAVQDFMPRKLTPAEMAFTDEEKAARIANIDKQLEDLGPVSRFDNSPEAKAKQDRIVELMNAKARYTADTLYDSAGQEIPEQLADYFDDVSQLARDENGNLIRFYHGTPNGDFDEPRGGSYFTPNKEYADVYQSPNASSISYGKQATNPATYEAYLDLRKPFDLSDPEARRIYIDEYVKGGNATGINPYQNNYDDIKNIDWTEVEGLKEYLQGTPYGYDSIIADEGGVPDGNGGVLSRGKSYIPFSGDQIFTLKKNLAQPLEQTLSASESAINNAKIGNIDISGNGNNSEYFMGKYGDAIAKAGADNSPEAMAALLAKRGNKDMIRDAFMTQQDTANGADMYKIYREYGGGKPAGREALISALTNDSANPPELVTYHSVGTDKLKKALNNFGSDIVNPSLQVVNPEINPGTKYGDIILLGDKDMFFNKGRYGVLDADGKTNAYTRDVYSPRVPDYTETKSGDRYIEGTRKPYTAQNVSDYMNKQGVKAVESNWATPGSVAATQSKRFTNLADILEYADKLGPKDANRKAFDDFGEFLSNKVWDYAEKTGHMGDNPYISIDNITTEIQDALNGRYMPDDFYGLRTPDGQKLLSDIRQEINKLPTDYFELKMNRPVELKEFSGAILPNDYADEEVLNALKNAGVKVMGNYDPNNMDATLQDTLKNITKGKNRFKTPYMLGLAGLLGGGAMVNQATNSDKEDKKKTNKRSA